MLKKVLIMFLFSQTTSFATCHSSIYDGYEYKALLQDSRQAELIYTCLNIYDELEDEDSGPKVDFCIYKSKDHPLYIEMFNREDDVNNDGEFQVGMLDDYAMSVKKSYMNDDEIYILHDSRNMFGIGYFARFSINIKSNNGRLLIKNKYDDDGVASVFSPTEVTDLTFKCKKVNTKVK